MAALQFITLHARFVLKAIFLAALAAPEAAGGLSAFAAPLRAPMSWARSSPGICRCSPVSTGDMMVGKAELINMGKDDQDVAKTSGLAMSLDSEEAAEQSADDSDENDVEARLLATRKEVEEEREKKTEEKKDLYLQVSFMLFELPCLSLVDVQVMIECCLASVALAAMLYLLSQYCFSNFKQVAVLQ